MDRNRVKRLIREAYRLNKHALINKLEKDKGQLLIAFIYTGKKMESFEVINEKMIAILKRFEQKHGAITKNS